MSSFALKSVSSPRTHVQDTVWYLKHHLPLIALSLILLLAGALRFANLDALGYGNSYYAAAIESMRQSWHNFFFAAAEPGGSVSVDKPPVGLWFQVGSVLLFGFNGFALLLPQIMSGILSVVLLYHLVQRRFGVGAGLLAALVLAIDPITIATNRNNTMDSTLILFLLLAAWAFLKATETGKRRYLLAGVVLVGIGFNIKMLEAFLPLPAFYALYLTGSEEGLRRKLVNLVLASMVLVMVSLSWAAVVDLTPASERPYVGSSSNNSVMELIVGYNGLQRLQGLGGGFGNRGGQQNNGPAPRAMGDGTGQADGGGRDQMGPPTGASPDMGNLPDGGGAGPSSPPSGGRGGGGLSGSSGDIGDAGVLRLFTTPLNNESGWFLLSGLFGAVLLALRTRLRWPLVARHHAVMLWGGWLLTEVALFSVAGFYHPYYLTILTPPLAAMVGIGVMELWRLRADYPRVAAVLLLAITGGTLALQMVTVQQQLNPWWLPLLGIPFVLGFGILIVALCKPSQRRSAVGYSLIIAALFVAPTIWAALTNLHPTSNMSLPDVYDVNDNDAGAWTQSTLSVNQELLDYLTPRTQDTTYLMAVASSMQGSEYVVVTGRPVLYMGGFMGSDPVVSANDLADLVENGELRYISWGGSGGGPGGGGGPGSMGNNAISTWVQQSCTAVPDFQKTGQGSSQSTLYECTGGTARTDS